MNTQDIGRLERLLVGFHAAGGKVPPLEALGLSAAQVVYLDYLGAHAGTSLSGLAEGLGFKLASVSTMVALLVERGFLLKESDARDLRQMALRLSAKGEKALAKVQAFRRERLRAVLARLSETDTETFLRLFEQAMGLEKE